MQTKVQELVKLVLGNPGRSAGELAVTMGVSETWVSHLMASSGFQLRLSLAKNGGNDDK